MTRSSTSHGDLPPRSTSNARRSAVRRGKARARASGAVFVEALVVVVVLILLHVALLYLADVHNKRLVTMRTARKNVWSHAMSSCRGSGSGAGRDPSLAPITGDLSDAWQLAKGPTLMKPLSPDLPIGAASHTESAAGAKTVQGVLPGVAMTTRNSVLCNERQADVSTLDIRGTIHAMYGDFL